MNERNLIRFSILIYWTIFWGLSVLDKIIPAVQINWVGKDFFTLFVKFFESLGIKDPIFATIALAVISTIEVINFVLYLFAIVNFGKGNTITSEKWFYRAILSSTILFTLFSIGDNVFGDRFQLLEHGLFWMIIMSSWATFKYIAKSEEQLIKLKLSKDLIVALFAGFILITITSISIINFSNESYSNANKPVEGKEVLDGVYKFDLPFLADRIVFQKTVNRFKTKHPDLNVNSIYTGPSELNSKKKTHMLLYLFTEKKAKQKDN
jgi:hypothetical protein